MMIETMRRQWPLLVPASCSALLGLLVMLGWHTHNSTIVQISPDWVPMQYNTAVCLLFAAGLLMRQTTSALPNSLLSAALFLLPCATLLQYLLQTDFGIDQLFARHDILVGTSHPGRMAPNTALSFMLIAFAASPLQWRWPILATASAALALGLGLLAIVGYITQLTPAYGWGRFTAMAVHTALAVSLISGGLLLHRYRESRTLPSGPLHWQIACGLPLIAVVFLAIQLVPIRNGEIWLAHQSAQDVPRLKQRIALFLESHELLPQGAHQDPDAALRTLQLLRTNDGQDVLSNSQRRSLSVSRLAPMIEALCEDQRYRCALLNPAGTMLGDARHATDGARTKTARLPLANGELQLRMPHVSLTGNPLYNATRTFVLALSLLVLAGMFFLFRSIYRRTQAEAKAAHLYVSFKQAIDTFSEGFAIIDHTGKIKDKNKRLHDPDAGHLADLLAAHTAIDALDYINAPSESEFTARTTDRKDSPIAVHIAPIPNTREFVVLIADLYESVGQLKAIEHQQALINSAFDASTNGIFVLDGQLRVLQANQTAYDWLQMTQETIHGKKFDHLISGENARNFVNEITTITNQRGITNDYDIVLTRSERPSWMQARAASRFSSESKSILITVSCTCIDSQKALVEQLNKIITQLAKSNAELDQFAFVASHDLKSPLVGIKNISDWLEEDFSALLPEEGRNQIALIRARCKRMMVLLDDLLHYSRAGRLNKDVEDIALHELARDIVSMYDIQQTFTLHCPDITVCAPRVPIETLLRNLVNNSIKHHTHKKGNIYIEATQDDAGLVLYFGDDGCGIPETYFDKVLRPFTTLTPKDKTEGSGMGLAIIAKVVDSLDGTVTLGKAEQGGLLVKIWLPTKKGE